jgi:hypothetical protein
VIPSLAHFIWIGREFPWLSWAAAVSAARYGGFSRVILHHTDDLEHQPWWRALAPCGVESRRIDPLAEGALAGGDPLVELVRSLERNEAKSNVLRVAILQRFGGVYLDLDTLTLGSLEPLRRSADAFCGLERIAFPASLSRNANPKAWAIAYARTVLRDGCRRSRSGWRWFRRVEDFYPLAANNAILGALPGHPLLAELVRRMLAVPAKHRLARYALGTALLQQALADVDAHGVALHDPEVFYPLAPEISEHWFRMDTGARLANVLGPRTRVVHWYASVRAKRHVPRIDPSFVRQNSGRQLLSALALQLFPETTA